MKWFNKYQLGFDIFGLILFLLVMLPNFIWFAVPAQNDVLRTGSVIPIMDAIASIFQVLTIACLCFVINKERSKLRFSPLVIGVVVSVMIYYTGWVLYYSGIVNVWGIFMLTIPPCLAFVLFALDRKNLPATLFTTGFALCHSVFAIVNYVHY